APAITNALQQALSRHDAGYPGSDDALSQAFAGFAQDRWDWPIDSEHISVHIDAASIAAKLMREYAGPDGEVMIMPLVYDRLYVWRTGDGVRLSELAVPGSARGGFFDAGGIQGRLKSGVRFEVHGKPHDALGRELARADVSEVVAFCQRRAVGVLFDV